jgi:uncharacterized protein with HEPN domain
MSERDEIRLRHMLDAAHDIQTFTQRRPRNDLDTDRQLRFAVVKCLEILGEAASHISQEVQAGVPELPWPQIIGMRNRMIHGYYDINLDIVWATVQTDLTPLIEALERYLARSDVE